MANLTNFVSRAGAKLNFALEHFNLDVTDLVCIDLGASTGGFTDCLLKRGAKKVYAVDTAYGELDWGLRNDARVVVMERSNALYVDIPELSDFISIDVGWTQQKTILPKAISMLKPDGNIISLIKPHYEAEKSILRKGKVPDEYLSEIIKRITLDIENLGLSLSKLVESPVEGKKGKNKEFLALLNYFAFFFFFFPFRIIC